MIREKIVVEYYKNLQTKEITLDYDFEQELRTYKREYRVFKNNGKVSKTDMCQYDIVNKEAERLLAERINLKLEAKEDEKRAITLARIVRKVYKNVVKKDTEAAENIDWNYIEKERMFDDSLTPGWVTIKSKRSHSKWYQGYQGFGHCPSSYYYQVPACIEKEARELQEIRKKHQNDNTFNFGLCDYPKRVVREADH